MWFTNLIEKKINVLIEKQVESAIEKIKIKPDIDIDYDDLAEALIKQGLDYNKIANHVDISDLVAEFDIDSIEEQVSEQVDIDSVVSSVVDSVDASDIASEISIDYSEIEIDYAELGRALVEMVKN